MRATKQTQQIAKQISPQRFYEITGHRLSPSYGGQKLMWIKDNEPHIYAKTYKMLNAKDFIILKLTNQFVTEYSDASSTCLMDLNKLCWSDELLNIMGIDKQKMPKLLKSTDITGYITNTAMDFALIHLLFVVEAMGYVLPLALVVSKRELLIVVLVLLLGYL